MGSTYDAAFWGKDCQWPKSPWLYGIPHAISAQQILTSVWRSLDSYPHSAACSLGICEQVADKFPFLTYLDLWISLAPSISEIWAKPCRFLPFVYLSTASPNLTHKIGFFFNFLDITDNTAMFELIPSVLLKHELAFLIGSCIVFYFFFLK